MRVTAVHLEGSDDATDTVSLDTGEPQVWPPTVAHLGPRARRHRPARTTNRQRRVRLSRAITDGSVSGIRSRDGQRPCGRSEGPSPPLRSARRPIRIGIRERVPMPIVTAYFTPDGNYTFTTTVMGTVRTLGREYSVAILGATETAASVAGLSESLPIPTATCYRRVSELTTVGLSDEYRSDSGSTSTATRYQRTTSAAAVRLGPSPPLWARALVPVADDADAPSLATSPNRERRSRVRSARVSVPVRDAEAPNEQRKPGKNDQQTNHSNVYETSINHD